MKKNIKEETEALTEVPWFVYTVYPCQAPRGCIKWSPLYYFRNSAPNLTLLQNKVLKFKENILWFRNLTLSF